MKKILFLIPGLSGGGAEKVLSNLVNNMDQSRFEITVQTIDKEDPAPYLAEGIRYKSVNPFAKGILKKLYDYWFRLCAELKLAYPLMVRGDYDLEVAYLECGATKVIAQSTNKKAKKIAWVHCDLTKKPGIMENFSKVAGQYEKFDRIICVSEDVRKKFTELFGKKDNVLVLHNVIDELEIIDKSNHSNESVIEQKSNVINLISAGRLTYIKGYDMLMEACHNLKEDGYAFHLYILGEGEERKKLELLIQQYGLGKYVTLAGFCQNPYASIRDCDLLVSSSRSEGLSTIIIEALMLEKCILSTDCTGMREILGDSKYGLLVPISSESLYGGIKKLFDDTELRREYTKRSAERGRDFFKSAVVTETQKIFEEIS